MAPKRLAPTLSSQARPQDSKGRWYEKEGLGRCAPQLRAACPSLKTIGKCIAVWQACMHGGSCATSACESAWARLLRDDVLETPKRPVEKASLTSPAGDILGTRLRSQRE